MTNEERQALIEHIQTELDVLQYVTLRHADECEREDVQRDIRVQEIALAALTAQPVAWLIEFHETMMDDYCREVKTVQLEKPTGHYMACATPLIRAANYEVQE